MDKLINYKAKKSGVFNNHSENPTLPFCFLGYRERRDGLSPKKILQGVRSHGIYMHGTEKLT
jgi:hypothetical protein